MDTQGIKYSFYSAANVAALQEARRAAAEADFEAESDSDSSEEGEPQEFDNSSPSFPTESSNPRNLLESSAHGLVSTDSEESDDPRVKVLSVEELEEMFVKSAPDLSSTTSR